ncbi:MAG TPA: PAS domain S-box protein [Polyangiaceae bacterium]|jgi:PAS domain S-box-containing protein|nr:PAS domain S-box protein [Polyangiaceae bacterium]
MDSIAPPPPASVELSTESLAPKIELPDLSFIRKLFESFKLLVVALDVNANVEYANTYVLKLLGAKSPEEVFGKHWFKEFIPDVQRSDMTQMFRSYLTDHSIGASAVNSIVTLSGEERIVSWNNAVRLDEERNVCGTLSLGVDITEQRRAQAVVAKQARRILELSTPILQIWEGVLLAPLIGEIEGGRAQQLSGLLLEAIVRSGARVVLLDVTGLPQVDAEAAERLMNTIAAARLVGASAIVTGMRPALAHTIVELGVDLSQVTTCGTLMAGLKLALTL